MTGVVICGKCGHAHAIGQPGSSANAIPDRCVGDCQLCQRELETELGLAGDELRQHSAMPAIGTRVQMLRSPDSERDGFQVAVVVGHRTDPTLGGVLELRLSNLHRIQRAWPSPTIRAC